MKPLSKIKKCTSLFLAMALTVALCIPNISVYASNVQTQGSTTTVYNTNFNFSDSCYPYDSNLPIAPIEEDSHPAGQKMVYWYHLYGKKFLFNTSGDVYAYRITVECSDVTLEHNGLQSLNFVYGSDDNFSMLDSFNVGVSILQAGSGTYWLVNDYANEPFYIGAFAMYGCNPATPAKIDYSAPFSVSVTPFRMNDMVDEIYGQLLEMVAGQENLYDELVNIYDSSASIDEKLSTIRGQLENIKTALPVLHTDLQNIEQALDSIQYTLNNMLEEDKKQTSWLEKLWNGLFGKDEKNESSLNGFEEDINNKSDSLNGFNSEIEGLNKPSIEDVDPNINSQLPVDNGGYIQRIFDCIYCFEMPVGILVLLFSFVLVSYVLYGKKG